MMRTGIAAALIAAAVAAPAFAGGRDVPSNRWVYSEQNPHYLDLKTDLSEARRELRNDLDGADDAADRQNAWAEYRREVADARADFAQEMAEKGVIVRGREVRVIE